MSATSPRRALLAAANRRGIAAMILSSVSFVANDALIKHASQSIGGTQSIFLRGVFGTVFLLILAHALGATKNLKRLLDTRSMARSGLDALSTMAYLTALFHLPLGNATAINMSTPFFLMLFAILVLKERPTITRWLALGCGFTGVLLIVQPAAAGFNAWSLLCVAGAFMGSIRDLVTRFIDRAIPSLLLTLMTAAAVTVLSGVLVAMEEWKPVGSVQLVQLAVASVLLAIGHYFLIFSMRDGEMSLIAPFRYSGLLMALVIGFLVWRDIPNTLGFAGIALLVGAGLYVLYSERARQRQLELAATAT